MAGAGSPLTLGGITFEDFEVPDSLKFPLKLAHHVHKLIGGDIVIDTNGPSPEHCKWSGRFRGANAASRCRAIASMLKDGAEVALSFGSFFALGVIVEFDPDYHREYEIPYSISFQPSATMDGGGSNTASTQQSVVVAGDIGQVQSLLSGVSGSGGTSSMSSANALGSALDGVSSFETLPQAALGLVAGDARTLLQTLSAAMQSSGGSLGVLDLSAIAIGSAALGFGSSLQAEAQAANDLATLASATSFASRAAASIAGAF